MTEGNKPTIKNETDNGIRGMIAVCAVLFAVSAVLLFAANVKVPFMMDDLWYSTNISDGSSLSGISDIIESQVWHYNNWGGRVFTHGFLQLALMSGETCADIINVICTLGIAFEMFVLAMMLTGIEPRKNPAAFFIMPGLLISLCPDFKMSMLWQAGCANYVYSTFWILLFFICYYRALDDKKDIPLEPVFMIPLGLITGWSTENMGPSAFVFSLAVTWYCMKKKDLQLPAKIWMAEGVFASLAGSAMCILAPGNFVRKDVGEAEISTNAYERFLQMLKGAGDYLFPSLLFLAACYVLFRVVKNKMPDMKVLLMLFTAFLSFAAFAVSPHYPDRAAFGTCVLVAISASALLFDVCGERPKKLMTVSALFLLSSIITIFAVIAE